MNNLVTRSISGAVFVSVLISAMLLHHVSFFIVFLAVEIMALREFYSLFVKTEIKPQKILGSIIGGLLFVLSYISQISPPHKHLLVLIIPLMFVVFVFELYRKKEHPISNISITILGIVYIAFPFSLINFIVFFGSDYSGLILLGIFLMIWIYDSFAYVFGVTMGKHKLFERVSPKKSWEGFIGGSIVVLASAYGISRFISDLSLFSWLIIATIIIIFGTFGDLIESLFKRSILIKDSGNIIPGHGGMLDRFDSVLVALPVIFAYLYFSC